MAYQTSLGGTTYTFSNLRELLATATPFRSGDALAGVAAPSAEARAAAQFALADTPLRHFVEEPIIAYETDEVTRLIQDTHASTSGQTAFAPIASLTVGEFRNWLLSDDATSETIARISPGVTPEMAAAVSKIMRAQDLILVGAKIRVLTRFRTTLGLKGRLSTRLQPNHPTDSPEGIAASMLDGLLLASGDAVIGINPVSDSPASVTQLLRMIDTVRQRFEIPAQSCVLSHITTQMRAIEQNAQNSQGDLPLDLLFQSIAGTEAANASFGVSLSLLKEGHEMAQSLKRGALCYNDHGQPGEGILGQNVMYFETGQGSALSANAHLGADGKPCDQQTLEARAYAVARHFSPMLVNTVVGFIGPEYLYDGKQITRAALEDHFCGKLLGLPMGCDICYTNHAEADQDDMDNLLVLLGAAGITYIMGIPGADDVMLNYQSTSFHDALYLRRVLGLRPAPEFEAWLAGDRFTQLQQEALSPTSAWNGLLLT